MHETTGDFIAANDWMELRCRKCRRIVELHPNLIAARFPQSVTIDHARRRLKCACGAKMPTIRIKPPGKYDNPTRITFGLKD